MYNKNILIKKISLGLFFLTLSLFLLYLNNLGVLNKYNSKISLSVYQLRMQVNNSIKGIGLGIESLIQAPKYKQLYLINQAKYQACEKQLNLTHNEEPTIPTILAINWPDYGYVLVSQPNNTKIKNNDLVVDNHNNLIGFVSHSYKHMNIVKTLYIPNIKLSVYIKEAKAFGILENNNGKLIIKNVSIIHPIKKGYHVYLLDSRYPSNILVGTINKVIKAPQSAVQKANLKVVYSLQDMIYINKIMIIKPTNE